MRCVTSTCLYVTVLMMHALFFIIANGFGGWDMWRLLWGMQWLPQLHERFYRQLYAVGLSDCDGTKPTQIINGSSNYSTSLLLCIVCAISLILSSGFALSCLVQ